MSGKSLDELNQLQIHESNHVRNDTRNAEIRTGIVTAPPGRTASRTMYGARSNVLSAYRNLSSLILIVVWWHSLATSHGITAPTRQSCKALLNANAIENDNARAGKTSSKSGQTWQCWNSSEITPQVFPGRFCLFLLIKSVKRMRMMQSLVIYGYQNKI